MPRSFWANYSCPPTRIDPTSWLDGSGGKGRDMYAIQITEHGGPEVMRWVELPTPQPGKGEVLVRVEAAGVNFIDVYFRTGLYRSPLPAILGVEGAGVVEQLGPE